MAGLLRNITSLQDLEQRTAEAVDSNFLLYGALFIFLMQAGFGMLEVGAVCTVFLGRRERDRSDPI